ncbi:MAG: dihydroneopterin aldolase [Sodalis sp. Fse]|nr:MAG: dihydroneopterin aldolase [Sodalis sp. Fle]UVK77744.1 MAG: dihydroneopterin aldolase [Sodalis sp. Fse]
MDIVFIEQLTVMAVIGIHDWEQKRLQKLVFDLELGWNNWQASCNDDMVDYLNYADISEAVLTLVSNSRFSLIEQVAEQVAERLMTQFSLPWIRVKVSKFNAVPQATNVGVIIERTHEKFEMTN